MKAFILAAGLGTRLLPFSRLTPKPLFPIDGRPILDHVIMALQQAACDEIIINTHHLHQDIEAFIESRSYSIPIRILHEIDILGTGGGIKNAAGFLGHRPFMVINSDILTDIPLARVYQYHLQHFHPVTMTLYHDETFNTVSVDEEGYVTGFARSPATSEQDLPVCLTFTGIQVLDPLIFEYIPENVSCSIIDAYRTLLASGQKIKAFVASEYSWNDIGTPQRYKALVYEKLAPTAFQLAYPAAEHHPIVKTRLQGDGSDRIWYRLTSIDHSLIMADHGIRTEHRTTEVDAFVAIGDHLHRLGLPVPKILCHDTFSGLVFLDDLGDQNLQALVHRAGTPRQILELYRNVLDVLIQMSLDGAAGFNTEWTYQTPVYSLDLIVEKECRYFVDAFLNGYLKLQIPFDSLADEFHLLASRAVESGTNGFMHRDFQSRNLMIKDRRCYVIDFQGGRLGPLQYDLASLLIDPYVRLSASLQSVLLEDCLKKLSSRIRLNPGAFLNGYRYCSLTRNLQILGAFGYLCQVKGKRVFEQYIPAALGSLKRHPVLLDTLEFPRLRSIVENL